MGTLSRRKRKHIRNMETYTVGRFKHTSNPIESSYPFQNRHIELYRVYDENCHFVNADLIWAWVLPCSWRSTFVSKLCFLISWDSPSPSKVRVPYTMRMFVGIHNSPLVVVSWCIQIEIDIEIFAISHFTNHSRSSVETSWRRKSNRHNHAMLF